jgi:hypothetical protein
VGVYFFRVGSSSTAKTLIFATSFDGGENMRYSWQNVLQKPSYYYFDTSRLGILKSSINGPAVTQNRKAAVKRVNRVPATCALRPQAIAPRVIAP